MARECAQEGETSQSRGEGFLENAAMNQALGGTEVLEELPFLDTPPSERWAPPHRPALESGLAYDYFIPQSTTESLPCDAQG